MKKLFKPVFNSRIVTKEGGLLDLMRKYDENPFGTENPNLKQIIKLVSGPDFAKVKPKIIHNSFPVFWNWVFNKLKDANGEALYDLKKNNFASPRGGVGKRRTLEERKSAWTSESLKSITQAQIDLFKQNKDLNLTASKTLICAYILLNGQTEEVKEASSSHFATAWSFMQPKISLDFINSIIAHESSTPHAKAAVKEILKGDDFKNVKVVDLVEPILDWVRLKAE